MHIYFNFKILFMTSQRKYLMKPSLNNVHITEIPKLTFKGMCMWKLLSKWEKNWKHSWCSSRNFKQKLMQKVKKIRLFMLLFLNSQTRSCVTQTDAAPCRWIMSPHEATPMSNFTGIKHGVRCLAAKSDLRERSLWVQFFYAYALKTCFQVEKTH